MVIGRGNGTSLLRAALKQPRLTTDKTAAIARAIGIACFENLIAPVSAHMRLHLEPSRARLSTRLVNKTTCRVMQSTNDSRVSVRSSSSRPCCSSASDHTSLYPRLDVCRFFHSLSSDIHVNNDVATIASKNRVLESGERLGGSPQQDEAVSLEAVAMDDISSKVAAEKVLQVVNAEGEPGVPAEGTAENKICKPPQTSQSFNMSEELFRAAQSALEGSPESFWSHRLYRRATKTGDAARVIVHYCRSKHSMELVCQKHFVGEEVIGFDLEWSASANRDSGPRDNVSLIQIASPSRIALFQTAAFEKDEFSGPIFRKIMGDPNVRKVGVNILADCTRLKRHLGIETRGICELSHLYKQVKYSAAGSPELINKYCVSLAIQVYEHLKLPLYKGSSVRESNWRVPLSSTQILYSAADAYAGLQLFYILDAKRRELVPCPSLPHHAELGLPIPHAVPEKEALALDSDDVVEEDPGALEQTSDLAAAEVKKAKTPRPRVTKPAGSPPIARDARIDVAELMAKKFLAAGNSKCKTRLVPLRAYYLWHVNEDLNPEAIARLLRDPPLKTNTVITYILEAITAENLPYDRIRLEDEILCLLNPSALQNKLKSLIQECERAKKQETEAAENDTPNKSLDT
ncbi:hypothetical protein HIM_06397 [Hirsutella minnesotensis 3608]|uniref:3'-5' exonuclease domain-containing protein n=1 Tax=Hirsutella minnesotensis 3608 TaxID=1043627 RepID=A0A0F7ZJ65_9HYPO|nr:hypothetical protein HIM_06397 [Hirsutella minnesotensis 3608]